MDRFGLGIMIPLWRRPQLSRLVLDYYKTLEIPGIHISFLLVSSPEDPFHKKWKGYEGKNIQVISVANDPVSDKWNTGIWNLLHNWDLNAISVFGSDDFANVEYITEGCRQISEGKDYVSADGFDLYSINDDELVRVSGCENVGACAFLSTDAIKKNFRGRPFPQGRNAGIDMGFRRRCLSAGIEKFGFIEVGGNNNATFVDVKWVGHNINGYGNLRKAFAPKSEKQNPVEYFDSFFSRSIYNKLRTLSNA